jgi:GntR family transcriptional regulator
VAARPSSHGLQTLDPGGAGPLYRQARRELQRAIESGRYPPGEALPSETELARALGVSIGTLRKAVDELVHEHVLVRRQGKGTFVALHNDARLCSVSPSRGRNFHWRASCASANTRKSSVCARPGRRHRSRCLRIRPGDPVPRIDNRLSLAGRAVVHDRPWWRRTFKGLTKRPWNGPAPSTAQTDHGITALRACEGPATAASRETAHPRRSRGAPSSKFTGWR